MGGVVVSSFKVLPGVGGPTYPVGVPDEELPGLPAVPPSVKGCNCDTRNSKNVNSVFVKSPNDEEQHAEVQEHDASDSVAEEVCGLNIGETICHTISFIISGSTWEDCYQAGLKRCQKLLSQKKRYKYRS